MCDPLTIAGAALSVGSTVANSVAASKAAKARDQALGAERIRQRGYDQEAAALNTQAQDTFQDFEGQREAKATNLGDYFATEVPTPANTVAASVMPTATNDIVTREMSKKSGEAKRFTDQQAGSLAGLRAFGDVLGDGSRTMARAGSEIGQIGGFKRGSSNVIPLELDAAAQKGQGLRVLGDLMGGFGGVALNAGLTGGKLFGGLGGGAAPAVGRTAAPATSIRPQARPASLYPTASGIY
jgi:hypothetical protein